MPIRNYSAPITLRRPRSEPAAATDPERKAQPNLRAWHLAQIRTRNRFDRDDHGARSHAPASRAKPPLRNIQVALPNALRLSTAFRLPDALASTQCVARTRCVAITRCVYQSPSIPAKQSATSARNCGSPGPRSVRHRIVHMAKSSQSYERFVNLGIFRHKSSPPCYSSTKRAWGSEF